uniref:WH1 domain-containing protein n=1 Tax=Romanomermis culicivorax TaxID=13658 RepID=A0A915IFS5_ROMCU
MLSMPKIPVHKMSKIGSDSESRFDWQVLLRCTVTKDMNYHQVMPTFHHWQIGEEKYGLKFMTTVEACHFHNKLQKAIEHLTRQSKSSSDESNVDTTDLEDDVFMPVTLPSNGNNGLSKFRPYVRTSAPTSSAIYLPYTPPTPTDAALVSRRLPMQKSSATALQQQQQPPTTTVPSTVPPRPGRSVAVAVAAAHPPSTISTAQLTQGAIPSTHIFTKAEISSSAAGRTGPPAIMLPLKPLIWKSDVHHRPSSYGRLRTEPGIEKAIVEEESDSGGQSYGYLEKATRYKRSYEGLKSSVASVVRLPGMLPLIPPTATAAGPLSSKAAKKGGPSSMSFSSLSQIVRREQCKYCRQYYYLRDNVRGACPEAPDLCRLWSRRLTCVQCAETGAYKCCPSTRAGASRSQERRRRHWRWLIFSLLALLLPCMWCYPMAWICARCCWFCGFIDKRHEPAHISTTSSSSPRWSKNQKRSTLLYR